MIKMDKSLVLANNKLDEKVDLNNDDYDDLDPDFDYEDYDFDDDYTDYDLEDKNNYAQIILYPDSVPKEEWNKWWKEETGQAFPDEGYHKPVELRIPLEGTEEEMQKILDSITPDNIGQHDFTAEYSAKGDAGEILSRITGEEYCFKEKIKVYNTVNRELDYEGKEILKEKVRTVEDLGGESKASYINSEGKTPTKDNPDAYTIQECRKQEHVYLNDDTLSNYRYNDSIISDTLNFDKRVCSDGKVIQEQIVSISKDHQYIENRGEPDYDQRVLNGFRCQNYNYEVKYDGPDIVGNKVTIEKFRCEDWDSIMKGYEKNSYQNLPKAFLADRG